MAEFLITTDFAKKEVIIENNEDETEFFDWMMATEYLIFKTAQKSKAGFEKAMELLCKGASRLA
jgi:hypothetical protein